MTSPRITGRTSLVALAFSLAAAPFVACDRAPTGTSAPGLFVSKVADAEDQFTDWSAPVNLGAIVNSEEVELAPFISKDGLSLYFGSTRAGGLGGTDIWVSQRAGVNEPWGPPQNLGAPINSPFNDNGAALSLDGHRLFFNSNRPGGLGGQDIYVVRRRNKRDDFGWGAPVNLGGGVNSAANDQGPERFEDDATGTITLYFTSNRAGGMGQRDIYMSTLLPDETFGPAVLVEELSTPFADAGATIRRDGLELILASDRPGTLGGLDLWVATRARTAAPWGTPVNLGNTVNSEHFDGAPGISFDGTELYFHSALRPGTIGERGFFDLWVSTRSGLKD